MILAISELCTADQIYRGLPRKLAKSLNFVRDTGASRNRIALAQILAQRRNGIAELSQMDASRFIRAYEVRPRKDNRGLDLISEMLSYGRLWYEQAPGCRRLREILVHA